ncbi:ejaculatory bulb-specific protein 3 [Culex quinquefasciatus]|uniref:ejaculatory bulb-specific protein 3 n=1 Tax=Culex quinquefasciatus TaxID=7176 RepID=UPI0018E2C07C|nr:ejaculatory bulb-specific protein 3 [Culex quinquefasciatus]
MKFFIVALALVALVAAQEEEGDKYTTRYDNIDLDEILKSDRLFKNYYACLVEEGRCTAEGSYLKRILPEALETNCAKCTRKEIPQRDDGVRAIKYMAENRAEEWKVLKARFDPENKYVEKYLADAEKEGIKL